MFGRASLFTKLFPSNPWSKNNLLANWDYNSIREVDWVSGAALMIRREVFEIVGGLDEDYFMYWEDTDWCKRIRDAGWQIWFTPDGEIIHFTGQGGGKRSLWLKLLTIYHLHRSAYLYFRKHYYKNALHPIAILTFVGMIVLVAVKSVLESVKYIFTRKKPNIND
jgi:GT2 family glycosyltransferase